MKKAIAFITAIFSGLVLCSCNSIFGDKKESSEYDPHDVAFDDYSFAEQTATDVLECFDKEDKAALRELFSETVSSSEKFDELVETAMKFYEGKSVSHNDVRCDDVSASWKDDRYSYKSIRIRLYNVVTDADYRYDMEMYYVLVDDENPDETGISRISFTDEEHLPILTIDEDG